MYSPERLFLGILMIFSVFQVKELLIPERFCLGTFFQNDSHINLNQSSDESRSLAGFPLLLGGT